METYTSGMAERFTSLLARREAELSRILNLADSRTGEEAGIGQRDVQDFKDMAGEESLAVIDEAQAEHAALELEQVLAARLRIAEHSFGACLDCGDDIDLRRLDALPWTPYCTACQEIREQAAAARR